MANLIEAPPQWGNDDFTIYLDNCLKNKFATLIKKPEVTRLKEIDSCFRVVFANTLNPKPMYPMQFLLRAHSAFLVASGLAMSGQVFEATAICRLCLEASAYGFYIGADEARFKIWINREKDEQSKQKARTEFTSGKILKHINEIAPNLGRVYDELYQQSIDFGAHPNEKGFSANTKIVESKDRIEISQIYLQGDGAALDYSIVTASRVGVWALSIFQLLYSAKWEILGIRAKLEQLRVGL